MNYIDGQQLNRVLSASNDYYRLCPYRSTQQDYQDWLEQMPESMRKSMEQRGYRDTIKSTVFRRFYFELYNQSKDEYMRQHLSDQDFHAWEDAGK